MPPKPTTKLTIKDANLKDINVAYSAPTAIVPNTKIKVVTVTAESTMNQINDKEKEGRRFKKVDIVHMNYKEMRKLVETNLKTFVGNKKQRLIINVLTHAGWRTGRAFNSDGKVDWYLRGDAYEDGQEIQWIYGIQIVILGEVK